MPYRNIKKLSHKSTGKAGERIAAEFLKKQGLEILETNYRIREGEIDIIAKDGEAMVFIEVKTRRTTACGLPIEAVDEKKQEKIRNIAEIYMAQNDWMEREVRFDIFTIRFDKDRGKWVYKWIKEAF